MSSTYGVHSLLTLDIVSQSARSYLCYMANATVKYIAHKHKYNLCKLYIITNSLDNKRQRHIVVLTAELLTQHVYLFIEKRIYCAPF